MLFQTWTFFAFFLAAWCVFLALRRTRLAIPWLLIASYVYYGWLNPLYCLLTFYASLVDYAAVAAMARSQHKRRWLFRSVASSLSLLAFFKYGGFLAQSVNVLLDRAQLPYRIPVPDILLPVGLSFFLFQSMSYAIDFYRGEVDRERSFLRYAAFVSLFPQLLAGPIERAKRILPQLRGTLRVSMRDCADGLSLFVFGFTKKVALADYLALYVNKVYSAPGEHEAPALLLATFAFGWQIYFDFSGYTDMARGIARLLGIRLILNFRNPYLATGLRDFWSRWHISLSTWFRDYLYIPLGGNRRGAFRTYLNMAITMLISGLWHGASWTFVAWGGLHALGRVLTRRVEETGFYRDRVPLLAKRLAVFAFVTFAWIFFRAESFGDAWAILTGIARLRLADPGFPLLALFLILAAWLYQALSESRLRWVLGLAAVRVASFVSMLLYALLFAGARDQAFIYFQF